VWLFEFKKLKVDDALCSGELYPFPLRSKVRMALCNNQKARTGLMLFAALVSKVFNLMRFS